MPITSVQVTIPGGQWQSGVLDASAQNTGIIRITMPPAWEPSAPLTFLGSNDGVAFAPLHSRDGSFILVEVVTGAMIVLRESIWRLGHYKFCSGTAGRPIPQAADRTFTVALE